MNMLYNADFSLQYTYTFSNSFGEIDSKKTILTISFSLPFLPLGLAAFQTPGNPLASLTPEQIQQLALLQYFNPFGAAQLAGLNGLGQV